MPINKTAREYWQQEPLTGEILPNARREMLALSRLAFDKDWIQAALMIALQKQHQAVTKALDNMRAVHRSCVFIASITPNMVGISYTTDDGRRKDVFCHRDTQNNVLMNINMDKGIEVVYCDHFR